MYNNQNNYVKMLLTNTEHRDLISQDTQVNKQLQVL